MQGVESLERVSKLMSYSPSIFLHQVGLLIQLHMSTDLGIRENSNSTMHCLNVVLSAFFVLFFAFFVAIVRRSTVRCRNRPTT